MKSKKKLAELMSVLGATFGKEVDQPLNRIYWKCFQSFTDEEVEKAVSVAVMTLRFFPKPVEIIELIPKQDEISCHEAWGIVMSGLEYGRIPRNSDIQEVIRRIGGWDWLCGRSYDDLHFIEKRFIEHYQDMEDSNKYRRLDQGYEIKYLEE